MKKSDTLKSAISILGELVSFDSTSRESNLLLIEHIQSYLENLGVESRLTFNAERSKANLWTTIGPQQSGGVVLSGHLDVVPVDGQDWSQDPFSMWQADGRLLGRGVVDMKGFVALALSLAPVMLKKNLKTPIHFAFSYDEEVGCIGVRGLLSDVKENLPLPVAVIVGEPTSMKIIGGHKGSRSFRSRVRGVPAHSSDPRLGSNSIMAAARLVTFLETLQQEFFEKADPESPFDPPCTTIDLGLIKGGTAANIIPEFTTIHWGMRILPTDDGDAIEQRVRDHIKEHIDPYLQKAAAHAGVITEVTNNVSPLVPDDSSPAEQLLRHLTGLNDSGVVSFGTEAGLFQQAGIPAVVFGPGDIAQAHQPDEFIEISQLQECLDFLDRLIDWAALKEPGVPLP